LPAQLGEALLRPRARLAHGGRDRAALDRAAPCRWKELARFQPRDLARQRLRLAPPVFQHLGRREQTHPATHPVERLCRTRDALRQGTGQPDRLVKLGEEVPRRRLELAERPAQRQRRALELRIEVLARAQECREDALGRELAFRAQLAQLPDRDAELRRQRLGEQRHRLEHRAQLVALQPARGERLRELQGRTADLLRRGATDDRRALQSADELRHLVAGRADRPRRDREALERVHALRDRHAGLQGIAVQDLVEVSCTLDAARRLREPPERGGVGVAGRDQRTHRLAECQRARSTAGEVQQVERARGTLRAVADPAQGLVAGAANVAQLPLDDPAIHQRQADGQAPHRVSHARRPSVPSRSLRPCPRGSFRAA
jgi:hypothetical protein